MEKQLSLTEILVSRGFQHTLRFDETQLGRLFGVYTDKLKRDEIEGFFVLHTDDEPRCYYRIYFKEVEK